MGKKIQAMAKTFLVLLGVVACCYAEAENGMFSLGEPGQDVSVPTDSAKPLLKPEDEAELSAMEDKRDHLMALVEEMETASPLDERKEGKTSSKKQASGSKKASSSKKASGPDPGKNIPKQVKKEVAAGNKAAAKVSRKRTGQAAAALTKAAVSKAKAQGSSKDSATVKKLRRENGVLKAKLAASEQKIVEKSKKVVQVEDDKKSQGLFSMSIDQLRQMNNQMKAQIGIDKTLVKRITPPLLGKMGAKSLEALDESLKGAIAGSEAAGKKEKEPARRSQASVTSQSRHDACYQDPDFPS